MTASSALGARSDGSPRFQCAPGQEGVRVPWTGAAGYKRMPSSLPAPGAGLARPFIASGPAPLRLHQARPFAPRPPLLRLGGPAAFGAVFPRRGQRWGRGPCPDPIGRRDLRQRLALCASAAPPSLRLVVSLPLAERAAPLPDARPRCCAGQRRTSLGSLRPVWRREVLALTRPRPSAPRPSRPPALPPMRLAGFAAARAAQAPYV